MRWFGILADQRQRHPVAPIEAKGTEEYTAVMSIELSGNVEEQLRGLALKQGRDVRTLVEEAVQQYLEAAAITDLEADEVAATQAALLGELPDIAEWQADKA